MMKAIFIFLICCFCFDFSFSKTTPQNLSSYQISHLHRLSNLCPLEDGKAVYRARALLLLINDSLVFNDDIACQLATNLRKGIPAQTNLPNSVKLVGNPITNESKLIFDQITENSTTFKLYNAMNQLVLEKSIA